MLTFRFLINFLNRRLNLSPPPSSLVTGVILAGGLGRRMGNVDKGLQLLAGRALASWVLRRLASQVDEILINANRNLEAYAALGYRVIEDRAATYAGPLAGMHAGLSEAKNSLVAFAPCDTPLLPADLVTRLLAPLHDEHVDLAVAKTGTRVHPVICIARKRLLPHLAGFLAGGGRKVDAWFATLKVVEVAFDDQKRAFSNVNTEEELRAIEKDQLD